MGLERELKVLLLYVENRNVANITTLISNNVIPELES